MPALLTQKTGVLAEIFPDRANDFYTDLEHSIKLYGYNILSVGGGRFNVFHHIRIFKGSLIVIHAVVLWKQFHSHI